MTWTCLRKRSRVEIYAIMFDIVKYISFKNKIKKIKATAEHLAFRNGSDTGNTY